MFDWPKVLLSALCSMSAKVTFRPRWKNASLRNEQLTLEMAKNVFIKSVRVTHFHRTSHTAFFEAGCSIDQRNVKDRDFMRFFVKSSASKVRPLHEVIKKENVKTFFTKWLYCTWVQTCSRLWSWNWRRKVKLIAFFFFWVPGKTRLLSVSIANI